MDPIANSEYQTHNFSIDDKREVFRVSIIENKRSVMTSCTCRGVQKCPHVLQVLAGMTANLTSGNVSELNSLHKRLELYPDGKNIISKAQQRLSFQKICPSCGSNKVARIAKIRKWFLQIFDGNIVGYKCKGCNKTW